MVQSGGAVSRAPRPSSLADVVDLILDKGLVIDAYVRVSLVGIELLTIDARVVIASVDTYLRFAEAVGRLELGQGSSEGLPELLGGEERRGNGSRSNGRSERDEDEQDDDQNGGGRRERKREQPRERRAVEAGSSGRSASRRG